MTNLEIRLDSIAKSESKSEALVEEITKAIMTDDEEPAEKGRRLIEAYLSGSVENFIIELTGWKMETLLNRVE